MLYNLTVGYGDLLREHGTAGRLEFYNGSTWGAVCADGFDNEAGEVACKQLGYAQSTNME